MCGKCMFIYNKDRTFNIFSYNHSLTIIIIAICVCARRGLWDMLSTLRAYTHAHKHTQIARPTLNNAENFEIDRCIFCRHVDLRESKQKEKKRETGNL